MYFAVILFASDQPRQGAESPGGLGFVVPLLAMLVFGYLLLFRPMQKQEKQRQAMVAALKKNDKIVNTGGIIGIVESIKEKEDEVLLKGGLRITKSSINRVIPPDEGKDKEQKPT